MKMKQLLASVLLLCSAFAASGREVYPLNDGWHFFFKSENTSDNARYVTLPHSWNTDPVGQGPWLETTGNYVQSIYIPAEWSDKRIFIRFYGAQTVADLFVNGTLTGSHRGGATAFAFEITGQLRFGAENMLLVVVSNASRNDVLPVSSEPNLYGGLYREAELIVTERTAISPLYLGTDGVLVRPRSVSAARAEGNIEVHLLQRSGECHLNLTIETAAGRRVFTRQMRVKADGKPVQVPFIIDRPERWSPDSPTLYTVRAVVGNGAVPSDEVIVRTGFRSLSTARAGGILLNDSLTKVRGVVLHHDNATVGGRYTAADYEADLREVRAIGANAVRSALMPHGQYLYDRCDEEGLLAWIDLPLHRAPFFSDVAYYATPAFEQNGLDQLRELIAQHINHPSVVMWGLFSRLWGRGDNVAPYLRRLNQMAHDMDPTRPTVGCSDQDGDINFITDLIVWRQNVGWQHGSTEDLSVWRDLLQKNWSHLKSAVEYGAPGVIGLRNYSTRETPRTNWYPEERQTRFHEAYVGQLQSDSLFWGVWVESLFDYASIRHAQGVNTQGLVTFDRRQHKDAYYLYRSWWNPGEPTLHIADRRHPLQADIAQPIRVYSTEGTPLLLVDGDTVAMHAVTPTLYRSDSLTMQGVVRVRATAGGRSDEAFIRAGNVLGSQPLRVPLQTEGLQPTD